MGKKQRDEKKGLRFLTPQGAELFHLSKHGEHETFLGFKGPLRGNTHPSLFN